MLFRFGPFELDTERRELRRAGQPVAVQPKVFAVLVYLIGHRDRMVPKAELLDAFWPTNVSEAALQTAISQLRKAVGDSREAQAVIRTYHGQGFRFVAAIEEAPAPEDAPSGRLSLHESRLVAVLCVRVHDDGAQALAPDERDRILTSAHQAARQIVEAHDGALLHIMLDGFTAIFGRDRIHEDAVRRAVYCATELQAAAATGEMQSAGLIAGFAVDAGQLDIPATDIGADWSPPGAIERRATALADATAGAEILIGETALAHLRSEVETEATPQGARLTAIPRKRAGIPGRGRAALPDLVGRGSELAFLSACLDEARAGRGQAVTLSGPPGIGKSRLVAEFLTRLGDDATAQVLHCLPGLDNTPFAPVRALFRDLDPGTIDDPVDQALLRDLRDDGQTADPALQTVTDHQRRQRLLGLIDRLVRRTSGTGPLVIAVEDIHWIDASSRDLFDGLVQQIDGKRLMLVMTTRPGEQAAISDAILTLSPLGQRESLALLNAIPDLGGIGAAGIETIAQRGAGNPFFLEELAFAALAGGDTTRELPDSVQAVVAARIGALDDRLRALLYVVAVIGPGAPVSLAAQMLDRSGTALEAEIRRLAALGFLRRETDTVGFRHMLISDTAYAMIAPADRARLHGEIAEALNAGGGAEPETLARHYQEAGETGRALALWSAACRRALRRSAHHEAIAFAEAGIALIDPGMPDCARTELDLQLSMALALTALRGYGAADVGRAYDRAGVLNRTVRSPEVGVQVDIGQWLHNWVLGRLTRAYSHAEALLAAGTRIKVPALLAQAHAAAGEILVHKGKLAEGLAHLEAGLEQLAIAPPGSIPAQNAAVACAAYAGWAAALMGDSAAARAHLVTSEGLRDLNDNPFAAAIHAGLGADLLIFAGDAEGGLALADEGIRISREQNFPFWLGTALVERGWARSRLGAVAEGIADIDEGIAIFEATGAGVQLANWYGFKAEALWIAGQDEDGYEAARHALDRAEETGDLYFTPRIHAVAARICARTGDADAATRHEAAAQTLARDIGVGAHVIDVRLPRRSAANRLL